MATGQISRRVVSLHQISRRYCLVAENLAGKNAEVLRESEGEEASVGAVGEVFGLECNMDPLMGHLQSQSHLPAVQTSI
ncbi:uncharacterized protein G2W53_014844 [Senna tora]|uniref:Uncharacterized protein n=1 Tax=Senna tora TaxID=362788 RepID=A0A835C394_9FABA|nr:uncharacterized protein G2W53_014844 [Senna tora]